MQAGTEAVAEALRPYARDEGVVLHGSCWVVSARKA